jgi:hypothetical protein
MVARTYRLAISCFCISLFLFSLALSGCCKTCGDDYCTPRSLWQSPTVRAMQALLLNNTEELRIIAIDDKKMDPTCISEDGTREYHLSPGTHSVTAVYRYTVPVSEGFMAGMHGKDATRELVFEAGHVYVVYYREHPGAVPEGETGVARVETNVLNPPQLYWSLELVDLAEATDEPEVRDARAYIAWVEGEDEALGK